MNTKKVRSTIMASAMALAAVGAFATMGGVEEAAIVTGYLDTPTPCTEPIDCSDFGLYLCTDGFGRIAKGKVFPSDTACQVTLYKSINGQ